MASEYFDVLVIIPLEEELLELMEVFKPIKDYSTPNSFRYSVSGTNTDLRILVVQQEGMGRTHAARAAANSLREFDVGLIVCLGIAGAMNKDVELGDVCYTGSVIDVYDNSKAKDEHGSIDLEFSPTHYRTMREVTSAFNFIRTIPELKARYLDWQRRQDAFAREVTSDLIPGRGGKLEAIGSPKSLNGTIVCGVVSQSEKYNKKLRAVDRKILAIETESGGIFEEAVTSHVPAVTIRGISDYADEKKAELEGKTAGKVRRIAARNAATFLDMQLTNEIFQRILLSRRRTKTSFGLEATKNNDAIDTIATVMSDLGKAIDSKLRELSPEFKLQARGYRLPVPRVRQLSEEARPARSTNPTSDEIDLRDVLQTRSTVLLSLPRNYPDNSLPWVLANDLLASEIEGKQCVPIVIDGAEVRPPRNGLLALAPEAVADRMSSQSDLQLIFIIENLPITSKTKLNFLIEQVKSLPNAKFIFIAKSDTNILKESEFVGKVAAHEFSVCNISFLEIAHFIQKNFSMSGSEAEVIALRLRNTFDQFNLSAHPTYFAGIPRETLSALLQANRRAELIQLAVDGFLTFIVADDSSDVNLSRTTRSRFLRKLAASLYLEKRSFGQSELVEFTKTFSGYHDFDIDPLEFIQGFINKGILHFENDGVRFSLPFIASYLLALELKEDEQLALRYFQTADDDFDLSTFDLYTELGAAESLVKRVMSDIQSCLCDYAGEREQHIFLTERLRPVLLGRPGRVEALQEKLKEAAADVLAKRDESKRKQRMLDIADRIRESAAEQSESKSSISDEKLNRPFDRLSRTIGVWAVATVLLGSGAEHLDAATKQSLAKDLVDLATCVLHEWTALYAKIDFAAIKEKMTSAEAVAEFAEMSSEGAEGEEIERLVDSLVDVLEFSILGGPFRRMVHHLCEQARQKVLATSVEKAKVDGVIENVIHATWLADIDSRRGATVLSAAIRDLPPSPFFRVALATHLLMRAYWSHSKAEDRLALLDLAEGCIKPLQMQMNKQRMIRQIRSSGDKDAADS